MVHLKVSLYHSIFFCVQIRLLEILFTFAGWGGALEGSTVSFDRVCMPMPVFAARRVQSRDYLENFIKIFLREFH